MTALIEIGLMNAPMALCLAGVVCIVGRFWKKQPALLHALWVLVLIKLLVPPLIQVPLPWQLPAWLESAVPTQLSQSGVLSQPLGGQRSFSNVLSHNVLPQGIDQTWHPTLQNLVQIVRSLFLIVLVVWGAGTVLWFCAEGWRIVRFAQVFLRHARLAPKSMQRHATGLAREMGLKRCPEVWLLSAVVSPMLWCVGGRARILFPSQLATQLDKGAVATLLTHELAHYYRGDHWVRMLEFVATGLFWWHPAVWVARREIEIHEEQCCDAWVVSQFPKSPRQYADALLATIDFLSEDHSALPAAASGLGDVPLIRQRLILIMRGAAPKSLGVMGRVIVTTMALLVFIQPRLAARPPVLPALDRHATTLNSTTPHLPTQQASPSQGISQPGVPSTSPPASNHQLQDADETQTSQSVPELQLTRRPQQPRSGLQRLGRTGTQIKTLTTPVKNIEAKPLVATQPDWLLSAMATAPNMLSRVVAHNDGKVSWQHFCSDEETDLSAFAISTVAYAPEGQLFVAGCRDGAVRVWDAGTGKLLRTLTGHHAEVHAVAISTTGNWLASGDQNGEVRLWSVLDSRPPEILSSYCAPICSLAFSSDGQTIAVAVGVPQSSSSNFLATDAPASPDNSATDSNTVGGGGLVAFWNLLDRVEFKKIKNCSPLAVLAFSLDSSCLSGAEWSGRVLTWNICSTELLATRYIGRKAVAAAAFACDSEVIRASVGETF